MLKKKTSYNKDRWTYVFTKKEDARYGKSDCIWIDGGNQILAHPDDIRLIESLKPSFIRSHSTDKYGVEKTDKLKISSISKKSRILLAGLGIRPPKIASLHTFLRLYVDHALKRNHFANDSRFDGMSIREITRIYSVDHLSNNRLDNRPEMTAIETKKGNAFLEQLRQHRYCLTYKKKAGIIRCSFKLNGTKIEKDFNITATTTRKDAEKEAKLWYIQSKIAICESQGKFSDRAMRHINSTIKKIRES